MLFKTFCYLKQGKKEKEISEVMRSMEQFDYEVKQKIQRFSNIAHLDEKAFLEIDVTTTELINSNYALLKAFLVMTIIAIIQIFLIYYSNSDPY